MLSLFNFGIGILCHCLWEVCSLVLILKNSHGALTQTQGIHFKLLKLVKTTRASEVRFIYMLIIKDFYIFCIIYH